MSEILVKIIVAVLLIGAIIWAIWYENFAGRKSETKETNTDS